MTPPADISPLTPRGLSRVQSAVYVGVGVTKFDEMVADGRMPKPKRIDGRTVWELRALDEHLRPCQLKRTPTPGTRRCQHEDRTS